MKRARSKILVLKLSLLKNWHRRKKKRAMLDQASKLIHKKMNQKIRVKARRRKTKRRRIKENKPKKNRMLNKNLH